MIYQNTIRRAAFVIMLMPSGLFAQQATVRDAFWSASDLITVAPNPASHKQVESHPRTRPAGTATASGAASPTQPAKPEAHNTEVAQLVVANGYGAAPKLVRTAENRLGLRCSIMLRNPSGEYAEVTPGNTFHSGDHIRLSFLANNPGYFYVIQQGSTGTWAPVFPPPKAAPDSNKIVAGQPQVVPTGNHAFQFDQHPGDEKLYIILSRTPIADIDRVIQNLSAGAPALPEKPESTADSGQALEAENRIPDSFVQRLASRDLSLVEEEKVDQTSKQDAQGEKAIYVVSKGGASELSGQVVLSLDLRHQ